MSSQNQRSVKCACDAEDSSSQSELPNCCLKRCFGALFNNEHLADVYFIVGKEPHTQRIPAHKFLLSIRSNVFCTMFSERWSSDSKEITVEDMDAQVFLSLLRFLYTDDVTIDADTAVALLNAAEKYDISTLKNRSVKFLQKNLCAENAFKVLREATIFEQPKLIESSLDIIDEYTSDAVSADGFTSIKLETLCSVLERDTLRIKEAELFKAVVRWSEAECLRKNLPNNAENQQTVLGGALFLIRFPLMPPKEFASSVARSGILSEKEVTSLLLYFVDKEESAVNFDTEPRAKPRFKKKDTPLLDWDDIREQWHERDMELDRHAENIISEYFESLYVDPTEDSRLEGSLADHMEQYGEDNVL